MGGGIVTERYCYKEETQLTVRKTSLFFSGDGFTVYDSKGKVVFRVDSYGRDAKDRRELALLDAFGKCILTVRKKRPSLHSRWEGFLGERMDGQKPIFTVRRASIIGRSSVTIEVHGSSNQPAAEYQLEGSFPKRSCTFYTTPSSTDSKEPVAEIKRKVASSANVVLGRDVFCLCLKPGFDGAFIMGLILVLDQINGDDDDFVSESGRIEPTMDEILISSPPAL